MKSAKVVVIGIDNSFRRDDGVGAEVASTVRALVPPTVSVLTLDGESARLVDAWSGADVAIVVDAVRSGRVPGDIRRLDIDALPGVETRAGTHGFGLAEAVELARVLDRLPGRLVLWGVEGADFAEGCGLTPAVARAVPLAARRIAREVEEVLGGAGREQVHG